MIHINPATPAAGPALLAAAHRPLFLMGAVQAVLAMLWWGLTLTGRLPAGAGPAAAAAHGWLMIYGLFPPFVFGFLFTALPNWVNGPRVPAPAYLASALLLGVGGLLFYPGLYLRPLALLALGLHAAGWWIALVALLRVLRACPAGQDPRQPWLAWAAVALGLPGSLAFALWLAGGGVLWRTAGMSLGVWGFLTPLFLAVCHRMLPWFTSRVLANYVIVRPYGPLWGMVGACLAHAALEIAGLAAWTWLADLPLAALAVWFLTRWGIARGLRAERLLAMLHIAFVWAVLAFLLHGLDSLAAWLGSDWGMGLAPLHALGAGFFASMLLAMASRVSLGHSGRPLKADGLTWGLFWLVQASALARMLPDLAAGYGLPWLYYLAALLWLLAFAAWAWRYAPFYWRPRADGKPG
ncbi:MAG TPA: NnrS family protein [Thiobacillaceae bacterium]|nr:NnrS family protein [Thiobacillaceae bacterium]